MHCGLVHTKLLAYIDGALPAEEESEVAAHLAGCWSCTQELAMLRREAGDLRSALSVSPPPGLEPAILRRIGALARSGRAENTWESLAGHRLWRSVVVAAAALALAFAGLAVISPPAYAMVISNMARLGAHVNAVASQRFPAWAEFVRVVESLRMLVGI